MLGKILLCVLTLLSACLVRQQTANDPKLAGIADDVAALLSKLGAKSTDEAVAKLWAKEMQLIIARNTHFGANEKVNLRTILQEIEQMQ